ncbi:hypothetical protein [Chryseobacterium sp. Leaf394]|uniref:hypothetical protein n=1 Tax=Chryseobacterium sp. Leaf394 TaxID=1736361 RepID=UPI0006F47FFE|nr:hypothetical protein [Chryseobacterium sp. Leaf394]KQS94197.1 hypothetical protein ASG21_18280 [Chryseobacterium sp. Leaf394]
MSKLVTAVHHRWFLNWNIFLIFNLIVLLLKIGFSIRLGFHADFFEDWKIAENLAAHGEYSWYIDHGNSAYKLPAYPLYLYINILVFGVSNAVPVIIITQHLFYFIIPIIIKHIFTNFKLRSAGILAAYLFILSPSYFYYSNILEATNLFILLTVLYGWLYSCLWKGMHALSLLFCFGVVSGILALTQVVFIPVMVILMIFFLLNKKSKVKNVLFVIMVGTLVYSPWVVRNYITFDKLILSKTPVWQNVFVGYVSEYQILSSNQFMSKEYEKSVFDKVTFENEFFAEKVYEQEVLKIVEKDNLAPFKKAVNNFISLWYVPKIYFNDYSFKILFGRKLYVILINTALLLSLIFLFRKHKRIFFLSCFLLAGFTVPYLVGHAANIRFKLDFEWIQTCIIALAYVLFRNLRPKYKTAED